MKETQILRFTTVGSVDDGKSTLIGRLLYDSKSIFQDQLDAIESSSKKKGLDSVDLSLLTDGLKDEREQGITIDVAYRYFSTPKRKFIIADTPGHIQYTRNMVTGASTANLALILVDVRHGVIEQTRRHSFIASLLRIPHLVVCVNKMDLVDYDQEAFDKVVQDYKVFAQSLNVKDIRFVPISALNGDNVVDVSSQTPWYKGDTLLALIETIELSNDLGFEHTRFPIQTVIRPHSKTYHDFRGYAGRMVSGVFKKGDKVRALPSGIESTIASIINFDGELETATPLLSTTLTLTDDIDLGRGDMLVKPEEAQPQVLKQFNAMICWLNDQSSASATKYFLKHTTNEVRAMITQVHYKLDVNTLEQKQNDSGLMMNDIAKITIKTMSPLYVDAYQQNRETGSFILIDPTTNETVAAGMIE